MDTNIRCQTLCAEVDLKPEESVKLEKRIRNNYYIHL